MKNSKIMDAISKEDFHVGPVSYCSKTSFLYINISELVENAATNEQKVIMKIYRATYENGEIKNSTKLVLGKEQYSYVHPVISQNGDMDIFYVPIDENGMPTGEPINMGGKINTSANELFPFYSSDENKLFFSSDGLFGLGGLDIFKANLSVENKAVTIENLKAPFNSSYDDFSFVLSSSEENGFFASNRKGGEGKDDIYSFKLDKSIIDAPVLQGVLRDRLTTNTSIFEVTDREEKIEHNIALVTFAIQPIYFSFNSSEIKGYGEKNLPISEEEINAAQSEAVKEKLRGKNRRIEFHIIK